MEKSIEILQDMFPLGREIIYDSFEANNKDMDKTVSYLISLCDTSANHPPTYEEAINSKSSLGFNSSSQNDENNKKRRDSRRNLGRKEWKPPFLGQLADDFLKVPNEIINNSASRGFQCRSCAKLSTVQYHNTDDTTGSIGQSYNSTLKTSDLENIDSIIRRRMEDNVSQTRSLSLSHRRADNDEFQYLDDERLALMLQNQEFLQIVQSDPEFQQALKEDQESSFKESSEDIWKERDNSSISYSPQNNEELYGYERSDINDPDHLWPDHMRSGFNSDENEVAKICKAMGRASRKRINSLAKKFTSIRRKKSSKSYLNFDSAAGPTTSNMPSVGNGGIFGAMGYSRPPKDSIWETESTCNLIDSSVYEVDSNAATAAVAASKRYYPPIIETTSNSHNYINYPDFLIDNDFDNDNNNINYDYNDDDDDGDGGKSVSTLDSTAIGGNYQKSNSVTGSQSTIKDTKTGTLI